MVTIIDYGMGNILSVKNAFDHLDIPHRVTSDAAVARASTHILLPGVGQFESGMRRINDLGLDSALKDAHLNGAKILGICLGMQLLMEASEESTTGQCRGLGFIPGQVVQLKSTDKTVRYPHMGWNSVCFDSTKLPICAGVDGVDFYFVHGFEVTCDPAFVGGTTTYGKTIVAAVRHGRVYGMQFHPEKSKQQGLSILYEFARL